MLVDKLVVPARRGINSDNEAERSYPVWLFAALMPKND
jgi:hypothetical protein